MWRPFCENLFVSYRAVEFFVIFTMDLPHTPTPPHKLYEAVTAEVSNLHQYILSREITGIKSEIRWKKQFYGAWCTVRWFRRSHCNCKEEGCHDPQYLLKETTMYIKNDFSLESFKRFIESEKSWINNFCKK